MTDELKPVPCGCGGEAWAFMTLYPDNVERPYICQCRKCFTRTGGYPTEAEAVTAWNRAMGGKDKGKWIDHTTCSECYWQMIDDVVQSPNLVAFNFCPNCGADMRGEHE